MSSVLEAQAELPTATTPHSGVVTYLNVDGALAAADFYRRAFGAEVIAQQPADEKGRTMHIHLVLNGVSIMLSDFFPEHGHGKVAPQAFTLVLMTRDIQAQFQRAVDAGCEVTMPVQTMFWGDLYGALKDPFGVSWAMDQGAA